VELSSVAEDVLTIFAHRFEMKNIQVERHYQRGVSVYIAPHELRQVVTNLVANAADAVADTGGCVSIHICGHDGLAVLLLEDNGSGVDPANAQRIFEPFFTTKEEVGTGIGLWVTRELVEKNGGRIGVESSRGVDSSGLPPGVSTRFRVEFPLANE
jgi:signal transduction histidine kinase